MEATWRTQVANLEIRPVSSSSLLEALDFGVLFDLEDLEDLEDLDDLEEAGELICLYFLCVKN